MILVFDVFETLIDISPLSSTFEQYFGNAALAKEWFKEVLQLAFVTTVIRKYSNFQEICQASLDIIEKRNDTPLSEELHKQILEKMNDLPPHADVIEGLQLLDNSGFHLMALTNSTSASVETLLKNAGLSQYFKRIFSADSVHRLKPASRPYNMVAKELSISPNSLMMVTCHSWDIAGAKRSGWNTSFVSRPGQVLNLLTPKPNFMAHDIPDLACQLIKKWDVFL